MVVVTLKKFNKTMMADARDSRAAQLIKNFDNFTRPHALVPYKDSEDAGTSGFQNNVQLQNFALDSGNMYALGRQAATQKALIYKNTGVDVPSWSTPTNGQDNTYTISNYDLFLDYKNVLWGTNTQGLWSYTIGTTTFNETAKAISSVLGYTQGIVHSKDSIAYFGYYTASNAYIARKNAGGAWEETALTIPTTTHKPVCLSENGNYLAILMAPINPGLNSYVLLWDRDSSVNTISEILDLGNKDAKVIEEIDGTLVVISTITALNSSSKTKIFFSQYTSGGFQVFDGLEVGVSSILLSRKQKYNNRLYFILSSATSVGGSTGDYSGVWSVGRNSPTEQFAVQFDRTPKNDTIVYQVLGFIIIQDFFYISYLLTNGGTDYEMSKTNDQASYTATSVFRTGINPGDMPEEHKSELKQLINCGLLYETITSGTSCKLKYSVDGGSLTQVFDETTVGTKSTKMPNASGTEFTFGEDIDFQIESKGVTPVGLFYEYMVIPT